MRNYKAGQQYYSDFSGAVMIIYVSPFGELVYTFDDLSVIVTDVETFEQEGFIELSPVGTTSLDTYFPRQHRLANTDLKIGYHLTEIPKGELGKSSKILEEVNELIDAENQGSKVMALVELSDLVGSIEHYLAQNHPGTTLDDLKLMASITKRAFDNGRR